MINTSTLKTDINREQARVAYHGTSFSPEKRGDSVVDSYIRTMEELAQFITDNVKDDRQKAVAQEVFDGLKDKYKTKTLALLGAQSRCLSPMITGPANFPVRRNEKANATERKRSDEWLDFHGNLEKYALKNLNAVYSTAEKKLTELEQYRLKLAANIKLQEDMKATNKAHKAYLKNPDTKLLGPLSSAMQEVVKNYVPQYSWETHPFAPCQLTNNNATIKRMKAHLVTLEYKNEAEEKNEEFTGLTIRRNYDEDRLQLLFDDVPGSEVRTLLKSKGFKWSPRFTAWQRQLTGNAIYATRHMLKHETMQPYARS